MKQTRTLALRREHLAELTSDELRVAAGNVIAATLKDACGGNTADSICTIRFTIDCTTVFTG